MKLLNSLTLGNSIINVFLDLAVQLVPKKYRKKAKVIVEINDK